MKKKTLLYKPGKITLYNRKTDKHFRGSLILNSGVSIGESVEESARAEVLGDVFSDYLSKNLDEIIFDIAKKDVVAMEKPIPVKSYKLNSRNIKHAEKPVEVKQPAVQIPPSIFADSNAALKNVHSGSKLQEIFKEYWDLINFTALFSYLKNVLVSNSVSSFNKLEKALDEHFYSTGLKPQRNYAKSLGVKAGFLTSGIFYRNLAIGCLIISFLSLTSILLPVSVAKINSMNDQSRAEETAKINQRLADERAAQIKRFEIDPSKEEAIPKDFKLFIPKIGLESDISPSVDLDNEEVYKQQLLSFGVAHAKGSYFPGQSGSVFLFAHSTDTVLNISQFNAKFFSLGELESGDEIRIIYQGKEHKYKVSNKTIINPEDVETVRRSGSSLILMTCTPPGTDWQRLMIFADEETTQI